MAARMCEIGGAITDAMGDFYLRNNFRELRTIGLEFPVLNVNEGCGVRYATYKVGWNYDKQHTFADFVDLSTGKTFVSHVRVLKDKEIPVFDMVRIRGVLDPTVPAALVKLAASAKLDTSAP